MSALGFIAQQMRVKHAKYFEWCTGHIAEAQWEKLKTILSFNAQTVYGQTHDFSGIKSVADYQNQVPIVSYAEIEPYISKMFEGQSNQLTAEDPIFWGMTTGSTGPPKYTPITPAYRDEYQLVVHVFLYHVYKDHPKAFDGKVLYFNGSAEKKKAPTGLSCGTMSGFNFTRLPKILQSFYAIPYELTVIDHTWSQLYTSSLIALQKPISMMIGITGAPMLTFVKFLQKHLPELIEHIRHGVLHPDLLLSVEQKQLLLKELKPNPKRANELSALLENETIDPKSLWPGLELLTCWKASHAGGFLPEMDSVFERKVPIRDAVYSATEGWCNIPYQDDLVGGPLALQSHFYEFIPVDSDDNHPVLLSEELEKNKQYRILYTTSGGMYRYDIGDILEVVDFYNATPIVKFVRKIGQTCNLVGELMSSDHITQAIEQARSLLNIEIDFYLALPNQESYPAHYDFYTESSAPVGELVKAIDQALSVINCDYKASRGANELGPVQVHPLKPESHSQFQALRVRRGADPMQMKPLVLSTDRSLLEGLKLKS